MFSYKYYTALLLVLFLSGCSYEYYIKDEGIVFKQRQKFKQLCEAKDRLVIYKTVQVDGYLEASRSGSICQDGWDPIFDGYQYAECTEDPVYGYQSLAHADIYRFTIENNGHPGCGTGKQWYIKSFHELSGNNTEYNETNLWKFYRESHQSQLEGKCLVVQKVDRLKSRYMTYSEMFYYDESGKLYPEELKRKYPYYSERKKGLIGTIETRYVDILTGKVIAKYSNHTFFPKGRLGSSRTLKRCTERYVEISPSEVLKPIKDKMPQKNKKRTVK